MSPTEIGLVKKRDDDYPIREYVDTDISPLEKGELFAVSDSPRLFLRSSSGEETKQQLYVDLASPEEASASVTDDELAAAAIVRTRTESRVLGTEPLAKPHREA